MKTIATNAPRSPGWSASNWKKPPARTRPEDVPALQSFLDTLHRVYDARGVLTDENGRDLLTNEDRSDLIRHVQRRVLYQIFRTGDSTVARKSDDGRFWFFFIVPRAHVGSWFLQPEHLYVMVAAVGLCYWLALYLTRPVRKLQKAVERFGRGDLSARAQSVRRDELGQLARTFDRMADRIETLLAAERRLLLDISHELRSPLARLGVAIELARSGDDTDAALNRILKESDRLNSLVGQLLQVTRAEGDPASLHRDPVRLDQLVQQLVDDSAIEAAAHGCSLQYQSGEPVTIAGDPELLRRAVENVLRNAIRYAPRDTTVEVGLSRRDGGRRGGDPGSRPRRAGRCAAPHLRPLLPRGIRPQPAERRHRPGPLYRAARGGTPPGGDPREQCRTRACGSIWSSR